MTKLLWKDFEKLLLSKKLFYFQTSVHYNVHYHSWYSIAWYIRLSLYIKSKIFYIINPNLSCVDDWLVAPWALCAKLSFFFPRRQTTTMSSQKKQWALHTCFENEDKNFSQSTNTNKQIVQFFTFICC